MAANIIGQKAPITAKTIQLTISASTKIKTPQRVKSAKKTIKVNAITPNADILIASTERRQESDVSIEICKKSNNDVPKKYVIDNVANMAIRILLNKDIGSPFR